MARKHIFTRCNYPCNLPCDGVARYLATFLGLQRLHRVKLCYGKVFLQRVLQTWKKKSIASRRSHVKGYLSFHLTISVRGKRATGKIQRNNYHHGSCGPSLTGNTSSVSVIVTRRTHRNVKNR